MAATTDTPYTI